MTRGGGENAVDEVLDERRAGRLDLERAPDEHTADQECQGAFESSSGGRWLRGTDSRVRVPAS
ncbi:hypothetical protein [Marinitenerispora sediminis]|uniref:Uncharacterized protein n=1 Tax=Marinitenerispora sediminis TaxID=1931232 RepID=A0A368SZA4_9ACTN|nr:hypothetical protein [Marinitenerispora sediminis]RCV48018.1 hypothetical protein DEF28_24685 [Marinitenerispora sediminis]RCV48024.1 hypothetical protein DEF23_25735 [Marinitenerispora sediminis]RCV51020.1 hypothetical protein DEF24_23620 [Marinitenerispora sediminis]